jgi:hypothetical protein
MRRLSVLFLILAGCGNTSPKPDTAKSADELDSASTMAVAKSCNENETEWPKLTAADVKRASPDKLCNEMMKNGCEAGRDAFFDEYEEVLHAENNSRFETAERVREHIVSAILSVFKIKQHAFGSGNHEGTRLNAYVEHEIFVGLQNNFRLYEDMYPVTIDHTYTINDIQGLLDSLIKAGSNVSWTRLEKWVYNLKMQQHKKQCLDSLRCAEHKLDNAGTRYFRYLIAHHTINSFP